MKIVDDVVADHRRLFIDGDWRSPSSDQIITVDSANTGRTIGSVPSADRFDVDAAVGAARAAFDRPLGVVAVASDRQGPGVAKAGPRDRQPLSADRHTGQ